MDYSSNFVETTKLKRKVSTSFVFEQSNWLFINQHLSYFLNFYKLHSVTHILGHEKLRCHMKVQLKREHIPVGLEKIARTCFRTGFYRLSVNFEEEFWKIKKTTDILSQVEKCTKINMFSSKNCPNSG